MGLKKVRDKKEYSKKYYHEHKEECLVKTKVWRRENPERIKEHSRKSYLKNADVCKARNYKANEEIKTEVLGHYSLSNTPCCVFCSFADIDALTLDHINNNGAEERKATKRKLFTGAGIYRWLKQNNFPAGYQTLCANCNLKKEVERRRNGRGLQRSRA